MVEKLELETVAHLSPSKVSWLQKGHQVTVTKKCLVEFKIGGYRDDIFVTLFPWMYVICCWEYHENVT